MARDMANRGYGIFATVKPLPIGPDQQVILNTTVPLSTLGDALMKPYLLIFELASLILLVAMVGVVLYMKRPVKEEGAEPEEGGG